MYKCKDCNERFIFPEVKGLDAGHGEGILGFPVAKAMEFCPECLSTKIKKVHKEPVNV